MPRHPLPPLQRFKLISYKDDSNGERIANPHSDDGGGDAAEDEAD